MSNTIDSSLSIDFPWAGGRGTPRREVRARSRPHTERATVLLRILGNSASRRAELAMVNQLLYKHGVFSVLRAHQGAATTTLALAGSHRLQGNLGKKYKREHDGDAFQHASGVQGFGRGNSLHLALKTFKC